MKLAKILIISAMIISLLFTAAGCRGGKEKSAALADEKSRQNAAGNTSKTPPPVQEGEERIELKPAPGNIASGSAKVKTGSGKENNIFNLISDMGEDFITPDDFEIGHLLVQDGEDSYALFIGKFFKALEKGIIATEMIDQGNVQFLKQIFESSIRLDQIPDNIRIGEAVKLPASGRSSTDSSGSSEIIRLNLRMFKGKNRTEGEIFLHEKEGGFKINSFNGDLSKLDIEYAENEGKFEPEIYRF